MQFNLVFVSIIIYCFFQKIDTLDHNMIKKSNKLNDSYLTIKNTTNSTSIRKLQESREIDIVVDTSILEGMLTWTQEGLEETERIKKAIIIAQNNIKKLIKIKTNTNSINILQHVEKFDGPQQQKTINDNYKNNPNIPGDLIIFVGADPADPMSQFAKLKKIHTDSDGRVLIGYIIINYMYDKKDAYIEDEHRIYLYSCIFMHLFIHFLGFDKDILLSKNLLYEKTITNRTKTGNFIKKYYVKHKKIIDFAQKYFDCSVDGIEFSREDEKEDLPNSHWEARFLLGDIMTPDFYYPEQVISEFTLILLDLLGWYEINYYTGGLMKYGKGLGCNFINKDCIENNDILFPNVFCEHSYGTCSSGRQSRSFCGNTQTIEDKDLLYYRRNTYSKGYGMKMVDYCPVSIENINTNYLNYYFIGSCNKGNNNYGNGLYFNDNEYTHNYGEFKDAFKETIWENSFCALSSIIQKNDKNSNIDLYNKLIRPTCYEMSCSEKSLTIQIGSEYIVCPRYGGLVKVGGDNTIYTEYKGYVFCPDYNLICTGTVMCNNIFDCIEKKSEYKESAFENIYYEDPIKYNSELNINHEDDINQNSISNENYELSEDGKCPLNCSQCFAHKRCTLCGHSNNHYIGDDKDDNFSPITCTVEKPEHGYYGFNDTHSFRCVEGCDECKDKNSCTHCYPQFRLINGNTQCEERIPNCKTYDPASKQYNAADNNGGEALTDCLECDSENNFYCIENNRKECKEVNNIEEYYPFDNTKYPCMKECKKEYPNCIKCTSKTCIYCDPRFYFDKNHNCTERIPNCKVYDNNSIVENDQTNNGGKGYRECQECEKDHYCMRDDKTICQEIKDLTGYYDYGNSCKDECENIFPFCLRCDASKCEECLTRFKSDKVHCVDGIPHCLEYDHTDYKNDDTYIECLLCDKDKNYYCIDDIRTICEKVDNISLYFKLNPGNDQTCYRECDDEYPGCATCEKGKCNTCKNKFRRFDDIECILEFEQKIPDDCRVVTHEINDDIKEVDFEKLIKKYFDDLYSYLNTIYLYVNKKYTISIFINSDCTESLLEQGYYKIDSKDLYEHVADDISLRKERDEFLFHCFIQYNNNNHLRFHNYNSKYARPNGKSEEYENIPFTLTNKYNNTISVALGPILSSAITLDKLDIFSEDSEVFTDLCQNVTLEGVDIPLSERLHYLYMGDSSDIVACGGENCELLEVKKEESISVCRCTLNEYDDLFKEVKYEIEKPDQPELKSSPSDSFGIIKCAKNGFHANNVKSNGGFYICLFIIVGVGVLILCYFLCSKIITTSEKGMNPPSKVKNRLRIISNWDKTEEERKKMKKFNEEVMNDFQPRDGHEDELTEEEKDYSYIYYDMSNSFDTALFEKKFNNNRGRSDKTRKILVLLPGTKKDKNEEDNFSSSESSPLGDSSRKKKKTFCQIYWHVLSLKQHIINFFSFCSCLNITESYIPLPIRIIRSLFLVVLSFLFSILFLNQKYYSKKFKYFNEKYKLIAGTTYGVTITPEEVKGGVPTGELWKYSFTHTFVNGIIVFVLLLVVQFLIGVAFFSLRNKVIEVLKKNDTSGINELVSQTRIKYIVFFIIVGVFLILFLFVFIAFGGAYGGGFSDYFLPGIVALIFLQIFPFLWSLVISLLYYLGIKQKSKCCRQTSRFFMF